MQLKGSYVFRFACVRGTTEELCKVLDPSHIVVLGLLPELTDRHVFDHAPTQRAYSLFGHGDAPVLSEGCANPSFSKQDAPRAILIAVPSPQAPYRASGLV